MVHWWRFQGGRLESCPAGEGQVLVYVNPDEAERRHLVQDLKVDEHTLTSALDPDELARLEFEPEHVAIIVKRPKNYSAADNFLFKVASLGILMFRDRLALIVNEDTALFEGRQFQKMSSIQDVVLRLIYRSIYHFLEHLKVINMCSDQLEAEVNTAMENRHLLNLFTLEKSLVYYLNAISSNGRVIERMRSNAARLGLSPENIEFLDDIAIENSQCFEQAQIYSQVLSGLMDARVSVVSNNLNVLIKRLNIIMIALMVPTLWVSLFSMNLAIPLASHPQTFWFVLVSAALVAGASALLLQRKE
ncbi:MAG TPA: magnesium transporter CorA family protein [Candidatus Udaeobacter sp.]|nr:magnesium transporter CorA family protein [Candidatus Udaeobacter sp.]